MPREGTETVYTILFILMIPLFGNKMPREGTETKKILEAKRAEIAFGNKMPREGTETLREFLLVVFFFIWK